MAATLSSVKTNELAGGLRMVIANATLSCSYSAGGETLNLSSYISAVRHVTLTQLAGPYLSLSHDGGTAAAGKVVCRTTSNGSLAQGLSELAATTNVATVVIQMMAMGEAV